jgi:membrane-associated phospholipid phosphatase
MPVLKWLDHLDRALFVLVQHGSDSLLDKLIPPLREPLIWIPLYAFMLYYAVRTGKKNALAFIVLSVVTVAITDSLTAQVLKPIFARPRPCHDTEMAAYLRGLVSCGGLYSLPSNHAANHFGMAAFWYYSIRSINGKKWRWLWIWAALVCYAQVYVGKHYPFDVLVGAMVGWAIGWGMSRLFIYWGHRKDVYFQKSAHP